MQQVKFFKGVEGEVAALERDINAWLKSSGVEVINMFGNIAPQSQRAETTSSGAIGAARPGRAF